MKKIRPSQRLSRRAYRSVRFIVRLISVCAILLVFSFVFLRLYGVPGPVLREIVRRANAAGIPVDVDKVNLSLHGWNLKVEAIGVRLCPSIDWGIQIPEGSACRKIDELELSIGFAPDRIQLSEGRMQWMGIDFRVNGSFIKSSGKVPKGDKKEPSTPSSFSFTEEQFLSWVDHLKSVRLDRETVVELDFEIDANDLLRSRLEYRAFSEGVAFREVEFSDFERSNVARMPSQCNISPSGSADAMTFS